VQRRIDQLDALTGWRFIAALAVFVHHIPIFYQRTSWGFPLGGMGVSFFFVLSGFILTYVYAGRLTRVGIKQFYLTRVARIWPLHLVTLAAMVVLFGWADGETTLTAIVSKFLSNAFLLQAWFPIQTWSMSYNNVSWSISTEMAFYALFPWLVLGGARSFWWKLAVIVIACPILVGGANGLQLAFAHHDVAATSIVLTNPLIRLAEFAVGIAAGYLFLHRRAAGRLSMRGASVWEIVAIVGLVGYWYAMIRSHAIYRVASIDWLRPVQASSLARLVAVVPTAFLIFVFAHGAGWTSRLLSSRWAVALGNWSFAFYMAHYLVLRLMARWSTVDIALIMCLASFVASLGIAALLFQYVEMPCKMGILALAGGRSKIASGGAGWGGWRRLVGQVRRAPTGLARPAFWIPVVAVVIGFGGARLAPRLIRHDDEQIQRIIAETEAHLRDVVFCDEATLRGVKCRDSAAGLEIELVWENLSSRSRKRFLHICDAEGQIINHGPVGNAVLARIAPGQPWVETIVLPHAKLRGGASIGIGFFDDTGCALVDRGPRSMHNYRLDIVSDMRSPSGRGAKTAGRPTDTPTLAR